jgi:hypothetical protein
MNRWVVIHWTGDLPAPGTQPGGNAGTFETSQEARKKAMELTEANPGHFYAVAKVLGVTERPPQVVFKTIFEEIR